MKHPDEVDALAPCGCWLVVDHIRGDRLCICDHGKRWCVSARQQPITYTFDELVAW